MTTSQQRMPRLDGSSEGFQAMLHRMHLHAAYVHALAAGQSPVDASIEFEPHIVRGEN